MEPEIEPMRSGWRAPRRFTDTVNLAVSFLCACSRRLRRRECAALTSLSCLVPAPLAPEPGNSTRLRAPSGLRPTAWPSRRARGLAPRILFGGGCNEFPCQIRAPLEGIVSQVGIALSHHRAFVCEQFLESEQVDLSA